LGYSVDAFPHAVSFAQHLLVVPAYITLYQSVSDRIVSIAAEVLNIL
jgi:hypothetical protein